MNSFRLLNEGFCFSLGFWFLLDRVSFCSSGWSGTHWAGQASFKLCQIHSWIGMANFFPFVSGSLTFTQNDQMNTSGKQSTQTLHTHFSEMSMWRRLFIYNLLRWRKEDGAHLQNQSQHMPSLSLCYWPDNSKEARTFLPPLSTAEITEEVSAFSTPSEVSRLLIDYPGEL